MKELRTSPRPGRADDGLQGHHSRWGLRHWSVLGVTGCRAALALVTRVVVGETAGVHCRPRARLQGKAWISPHLNTRMHCATQLDRLTVAQTLSL